MLMRRTPNTLDRIFEDWTRSINAVTQNNTLALDVHENDEAYIINTDIPGFNPDEIDIRLHDDVLTISAENNIENEETADNGNLLVQERRYGKFSRSLRFPAHVNSELVDADYNNGVLTITVPKAEDVKPRRIAVNTARNN